MKDCFISNIETSNIKFCSHCDVVEKLQKICQDKRVLIVASEGAIHRNNFGEWKDSCLLKKGFWLKEVYPNPNIEIVVDALERVKSMDFELIVAIGGGSAIDLAKTISALKNIIIDINYDWIEECIIKKVYKENKKTIPICAIPTTAGTGSEVTKWATVWDNQKMCKHSVEMDEILPKYVFIVPELTMTMPQDVTVSTALDALAHATESFWSNARNTQSQTVALQSIVMIAETLPKLLENQNDLTLRKNMLEASLLAGIAFAQTKTTACHSISYPLTLLFNIPHGVAVAITLTEVAERNLEAVPEIREIFSVFEKFGSMREWMLYISKFTIGLRLSKWGVKKFDLDRIASESFTLGRMNNNPVSFTKMDIRQILEKVF